MKTSSINIRVDENLKSGALEVLDALGLSLTDAIKVYLKQIVMNESIPFELKLPKYNAETIAAMEEARLISEGKIKVKTYSSVREMFDELDAEDDDV